MSQQNHVLQKENRFQKLLKTLKPFNFLMLLLAGVVNAFGVTLFLYPARLFDGGISGLSMLLDQVTPSYLTLSLFLIFINTPIFIFGWKRQGTSFTVYSLFTVAVYSVMSLVFMNIFDLAEGSPLAGTDLLLCAIFGGLISGIGSGLTIRFEGAIDGIDVLSVTFAKKLGLSLGTFVLIFNILLYIVCGIVTKSWILPLYSILAFYIGSKTIDFVVEGFNRSISAMIVTTKSEEITKALSTTFSNSGTVVNGFGGYSKTDRHVIFFILNQFQVNKLKTIVKEIDPTAYIALQSVSDVVKTASKKG